MKHPTFFSLIFSVFAWVWADKGKTLMNIENKNMKKRFIMN